VEEENVRSKTEYNEKVYTHKLSNGNVMWRGIKFFLPLEQRKRWKRETAIEKELDWTEQVSLVIEIWQLEKVD